MQFLDILHSLAQAQSIPELDHLLKLYLSSQGISGYTFSYYRKIQNRSSKLHHEVVSERLKTWHNYYHEEDYVDKDTTHQEVNKSLLPVFWDTREQLKNAKTEKERRMRQESVNFGVTQGLSIPLHGPQGDFAELTLRQFSDEDCLKNWVVRQNEWYMMALAYFNYLRALILKTTFAESRLLTKREQQCLNLLAENYPLGEMAKMLNMTERTVNFHIQNINHKLKVRNKYEAVAKAGELGLLIKK